MTDITDLIASPCVRNCCLNEEDVCLGCFRSLVEIIGWSDASQIEKQQVLDNAVTRRMHYEERYQARKRLLK